MIGTTISHYKILEKIGEGGMGVVYKAQDTKLKRTVALKFLPPELLCDSEAKTRFLHEAQAASSLSHPNITTIYDVDEADQKCFISMEYVEGKSLQSLIYERPLRVDEILRISEQIAEGLKAAHRKEVVHRDIKSANVMVSDQGEVKIMDFGLAKLKGATKLTRTGTTLGTFQYMSPEQAQGKEVDCRSDIFSFGVVLYEMISQKLPFTGEHEAAIIYSVINERHEPLNQIVPPIPPQLERIVDKALAKDRDKRYQNMDELLSDLKEIPSTYPETKIITRRRKYPLMASISVLALVFLALLAYFVAKPGKKPPSGERIPVAQTEQQLAEKKKSLAVMYLENLSGDEKTDVVRAGLYEGITSNLSRISKLLIVPKKEILDFKDKKVEPKEIVDRTGAKYILSGTVQMIGQTIRLTMQLLDPLTNTVLWLDKYPCTEKELFEVQDKVALQVFDKLGISLTDDQKALFGKKEEINEKARKLIERGLYYYDNKSYPLALESFQQALKEDESYFRTHYYLGQTYQAMERWKEAIEEYQLALPEAEKFKRVKYTCQFLDSLPEEIELYRSEDGKVVGYWYDPKDETMNWKCVDILNGRVLFEKKIRAEKGTVCIQDSSYRQLWLGWRDNTSIPTDLIKHKVYMINTNGDLLWEFGDSTSDFSYAINYGPYVRVANERNDSLYLLDRNGLFLAMVESDKQATVWYDYFFGYDGVSRKLYTRSIKKLDKIITRSLHLGEYYNRNISAIVDTTNLSNYIITHIGLTDLKNKFELDAAPFNEYNCRLGKDHLFCFANDSNLYAYRIEKPFYQERLAWRTHIGEPRSGKSSLEGSFLYVYGVLDTVVVMTKSADLYGLDVKKGEVAWHVNIGNRLSDANMQTVIRNNNLIIFTRSDISVIDIRSGELKWTKNTRYYSNEIYHDLILAWTTKDILSALQIDDGSVAFSCRTEHAWLDTVNNRIFYGSSIEFKELNPEIYQSGGKLQEDQIMKQIGICYFRLENNEKADSIFTYVTDELGIEDPDCYYYKYLIQKKVGRNDSSIVYLENYYDLIKDIRIDKEKEARQMFQDDHGVSIIRNRAVEHRESFRRVFALDSLLLVAGSSIAGFQYTLEPPRASYYTGPGKLSLCAIDKSTGLLVWDTTIDGILPNKILQENKLLFENYVHNTSTKRVGFSIKLLGLDSRKLLWERQLIEGSDETSCFKILAADSNHICAYFQDPFWPSGADTRLPKDSADFHFWLLNAKTGEVEKGKQIRLSADTNTFANIYADEDYVLIPLEKKIIVLDIETFEQHWQIETSAPITSLTSNENIIYIGTMNKCYSAYDEKTRTLVWRSKLPFPLESGYIPAITYLRENTFLDYWDNKNIFCFDLRSGITDDRRIRWRFKVDSVCPDAELSWWQTWKLEKDKLFVNLDNCKEFTYIILERNTGKFLKGVKLPWSDVYGSRVVVSDNTIYCLTGDGLFYKMECFK